MIVIWLSIKCDIRCTLISHGAWLLDGLEVGVSRRPSVGWGLPVRLSVGSRVVFCPVGCGAEVPSRGWRSVWCGGPGGSCTYARMRGRNPGFSLECLCCCGHEGLGCTSIFFCGCGHVDRGCFLAFFCGVCALYHTLSGWLTGLSLCWIRFVARPH